MQDQDAFLDTAAVMMNCDLIITSDTAVAHLAGALGCQTWVALKYVPDWRWMLDRSDSPWYPTMTLYRQKIQVIGLAFSTLSIRTYSFNRLEKDNDMNSPQIPISWGELLDKITILQIKYGKS